MDANCGVDRSGSRPPCSRESSWPKEWSDVFYRTDSVLDVADIDRYSDGLGRNVTKVRILDGVHDLALSARPVRENVYRELFEWLKGRDFCSQRGSLPVRWACDVEVNHEPSRAHLERGTYQVDKSWSQARRRGSRLEQAPRQVPTLVTARSMRFARRVA